MKQLILTIIAAAIYFAVPVQAQDCVNHPEQCSDPAPDPGETRPAPPHGCFVPDGYHDAVPGGGLVVVPGDVACDQFILFGDASGYAVLPPLPEGYPRAQQQEWADQAWNGGPFTETHAHYVGCWQDRAR